MINKKKTRTRPPLEAVSADGEFLVLCRGDSVKISRVPNMVSVSAVPLQLEEDPSLRPYRHADYLREITCSDSPNREY